MRILWGPRVWRNAYFFPLQQFWPLGCLCLFILLLFWRGVLHFPYFSLFNRRSQFVLVLMGGSRIGDSWNKHLQESYEVIIFCRMVCVLVAVYFVSRFYTFCFIFFVCDVLLFNLICIKLIFSIIIDLICKKISF